MKEKKHISEMKQRNVFDKQQIMLAKGSFDEAKRA